MSQRQGLSTIATGVATAGFGVAQLARRETLANVAGVVIGTSAVISGVLFLAQRQPLDGLLSLAGAVAVLGFAATRTLRTPGGSRFMRWLNSLTQEPADAFRPTGGQPDDAVNDDDGATADVVNQDPS